MPEITGFLQDCDLVKFADVTPTLEECERVLGAAERMVRATTPLRRRAVADEGGAAVSPPSGRWVRGTLVGLSTLAALALACVWPALARGEAWESARWAAWPGPLGAHPSTADALSWVVRASGCLALCAGVLGVPFVVWRMTLGADSRVPRLGVPTIAPARTRSARVACVVP